MPVAMIDKILKHSKKASRKDLEKDWAEAKNIAKDSYGEEGDKTWGTATKIFKNKIKSHYGIDYGKIKKKKPKNENLITKFDDFVNETMEETTIGQYRNFQDAVAETDEYEFLEEIRPYFDDGYDELDAAKKLDLPLEMVQNTYYRLAYPNKIVPLDWN